jgi:hypothetical protein
MSDDLVDLDTIQLFLFQSGIPQRELLRQDHPLSSRMMTREHFDVTRRLMYIRVVCNNINSSFASKRWNIDDSSPGCVSSGTFGDSRTPV